MVSANAISVSKEHRLKTGLVPHYGIDIQPLPPGPAAGGATSTNTPKKKKLLPSVTAAATGGAAVSSSPSKPPVGTSSAVTSLGLSGKRVKINTFVSQGGSGVTRQPPKGSSPALVRPRSGSGSRSGARSSSSPSASMRRAHSVDLMMGKGFSNSSNINDDANNRKKTKQGQKKQQNEHPSVIEKSYNNNNGDNILGSDWRNGSLQSLASVSSSSAGGNYLHSSRPEEELELNEEELGARAEYDGLYVDDGDAKEEEEEVMQMMEVGKRTFVSSHSSHAGKGKAVLKRPSSASSSRDARQNATSSSPHQQTRHLYRPTTAESRYQSQGGRAEEENPMESIAGPARSLNNSGDISSAFQKKEARKAKPSELILLKRRKEEKGDVEKAGGRGLRLMEATRYVKAAEIIQRHFRKYQRRKLRSSLKLSHVLSLKKEEIMMNRKEEYAHMEKTHSRKLKMMKEKEEKRLKAKSVAVEVSKPEKNEDKIEEKPTATKTVGSEGKSSALAGGSGVNETSSNTCNLLKALCDEGETMEEDETSLLLLNSKSNVRKKEHVDDMEHNEADGFIMNDHEEDEEAAAGTYLSRDFLDSFNQNEMETNLDLIGTKSSEVHVQREVLNSEQVEEQRKSDQSSKVKAKADGFLKRKELSSTSAAGANSRGKSDSSSKISGENKVGSTGSSKPSKLVSNVKGTHPAAVKSAQGPTKTKSKSGSDAPSGAAAATQYGNLSQSKVKSILSYLDQIEQDNNNEMLMDHQQQQPQVNDFDGMSITTCATASQSRSRSGAHAINSNSNVAPPRLNPHLGSLNGFDGVSCVGGVGGEDFEDTSCVLSASGFNMSSVVVNDGVKSQIIQHQLEIDHQRKTVNLLKDELQKQKEVTKKLSHDKVKSEKAKLSTQKSEYEQIIKRHLQFIDQLMEDKKTLTSKCETLLEDHRALEKKTTAQIASSREQHAKELRNQKDVILASEKIKRENWITEKTKKIKELTIKGLEPEIQRMVSNHKQELKGVKLTHHQEMMKLKSELTEGYEQKIEEIRAKLMKERDEAEEKERRAARERYEKQAKEDEREFLGQRQRLQTQFNEERDALKEKLAEQKDKNSKLSSVYEVKMKECVDELSNSHRAEIERLKEKLQIEKEEWQTIFMKKQEQARAQQEMVMKQQMKKQRDHEIELVISRLEKETTNTQRHIESEAGAKRREVEGQYQREIEKLKESEKRLSDKFVETLEHLKDVEDDHANMKKLYADKQADYETLRKMTNKLTAERSNVTEKVREEFVDKLLSLEKEKERYEKGLKAQQKREEQVVADIIKAKDEELDSLNERVRNVIGKKDLAILALREQLQAQDLKIVHMENFLQEKRKELLK
eukprot:Nk52_evm51s242 gene=Nk52_evmTU51s242